jgi:hypothetical protein
MGAMNVQNVSRAQSIDITNQRRPGPTDAAQKTMNSWWVTILGHLLWSGLSIGTDDNA